MNKAFLPFLLALFLSTAQGQNSRKIEEAVGLTEHLADLINASERQTLDPKLLQDAKVRKASVKAGLREVMAEGTKKEKDAAEWLDMMTEFYILDIQLNSARASESYTAMVEFEPRLYSYLDPKKFPIEYTYQGTYFSFSHTAMEKMITRHYAKMLDKSLALVKNRDAMEYARLVLDSKLSVSGAKYLAIYSRQSILRSEGRPLAERLDSYVEGLEVWKTLDADMLAKVKQNGFRNFDQMADSILLLSPKVSDGDRRAGIVLAAVRQLATSDAARSTALLNSLGDVKIQSRYNLERMYRHADTLGLIALMKKALASWEGLGASAIPQVASLRAIAATVLKTEPSKGQGFRKISGDSTKSRFYTLGALRSTVCLTGAIECITTGFTNTMTGLETSYWQCVVAEEPNAKLNGSLRPLYRELCGELGMLYRDDPMEYAYGDPNYYTLKLSKSWEVQISYYLNANTGTDIIMMVVKCVK